VSRRLTSGPAASRDQVATVLGIDIDPRLDFGVAVEITFLPRWLVGCAIGEGAKTAYRVKTPHISRCRGKGGSRQQ
jgi:hypothetical protein